MLEALELVGVAVRDNPDANGKETILVLGTTEIILWPLLSQ